MLPPPPRARWRSRTTRRRPRWRSRRPRPAPPPRARSRGAPAPPTTAAGDGVAWDTKAAASGTHALTARARDAAGNGATSAAVSVTVVNDLTAPTVAMTAPAAGATVGGTVTVSASATDNVGVVGVQFKLDGANLGAEVTAAPYTVPWDTTTASNAAHTLTAVARDAAGNAATSAAV